jgi:hypothetical protein
MEDKPKLLAPRDLKLGQKFKFKYGESDIYQIIEVDDELRCFNTKSNKTCLTKAKDFILEVTLV